MANAGKMGVVLLCAEDDDLELVSWVHIARKHGITPEVVTGVERDDEPLIEAIAMTGSALFILLRSDNLQLPRCKQLKAVFARHRHPGQDMLALRLQPEEAETALEKIAVRLGRKVRPRTGSMPAIQIHPPSTPVPIVDESTPMHEGSDPTGVFEQLRESSATPLPVAVEAIAPPVAAALDWARRATELEITEPQPRIEAPPPSASVSTSTATSRVRPAGVVVLATITALVMVAALVGGALWMGQANSEATDAALAPIDDSIPERVEPGTTARIPTIAEPREPVEAQDAAITKPRASHERPGKRTRAAGETTHRPLAESVPPPPAADASTTAPPVAESAPTRPESHAEAAPPTPPAEVTSEPAVTADAVKRPPA